MILACLTVLGPMVTQATALHELGHDAAHGAHAAPDAMPVMPVGADEGGGDSGALHALAQDGYCCAQGGALPAHVGDFRVAPSSGLMFSCICLPAPARAPAGHFRPPIAP